jgi:hypothetical protein
MFRVLYDRVWRDVCDSTQPGPLIATSSCSVDFALTPLSEKDFAVEEARFISVIIMTLIVSRKVDF